MASREVSVVIVVCVYKDTEGRKQTVEHLVSKGTNRELVGEYKNLLLSCSVTEDDATLLGVTSTVHPALKHCGDSKGGENILRFVSFLAKNILRFVQERPK